MSTILYLVLARFAVFVLGAVIAYGWLDEHYIIVPTGNPPVFLVQFAVVYLGGVLLEAIFNLVWFMSRRAVRKLEGESV